MKLGVSCTIKMCAQTWCEKIGMDMAEIKFEESGIIITLCSDLKSGIINIFQKGLICMLMILFLLKEIKLL